MNTLTILSLVSLLGWLALMIYGWRGQQVGRAGTMKIVLVWIGIFLTVTLVMGLITS